MQPTEIQVSWQQAGVLFQLEMALKAVSDEDYNRLLPVFDMQSIGAHCRHIIEFYQCLLNGLSLGEICYEKRARDLRLQTERPMALEAIEQLVAAIPQNDMPLQLKVSELDGSNQYLQSSFLRELHYVSEHAIHHIALIKIGFASLGIATPPNFGVATSTIQYRNTCAS
ncbi:MAG: DinB family protein [Chitinophagaceae bacterium]|jgi:hypothetical protein|nr:DinB family protein [Chitinophagaceae bacterium]